MVMSWQWIYYCALAFVLQDSLVIMNLHMAFYTAHLVEKVLIALSAQDVSTHRPFPSPVPSLVLACPA